jgi:beta-barrel assembly-enhancing protease
MQTISAFSNRCLDFVLPRNVVTGSRELHFIPLWVEDKVGEYLYSSYISSSGGKSEKYAYLVDVIGAGLAEHSPRKGMKFEFTVVNDSSLNAWCLPGGKIAINLGLLEAMREDNRDDLFYDRIAAVLSHEITHATARHFGRTMELRIMLVAAFKIAHVATDYFINQYYNPQIEKAEEKEKEKMISNKLMWIAAAAWVFNTPARYAVSGLGLCSGRKHELEADKFGMHLLKKVNRRLDSAIWLQEFFEKKVPQHSHSRFSQLFSSHPTPAERKAANIKTMEELTKNV